MRKFAIAVLAAVTLGAPAMSGAGDEPSASGKKSISFVPHHSNQHVYGSPIEPPIVGRSKISHHKHASKKRPASRDAS
jgi:hypothetical protein